MLNGKKKKSINIREQLLDNGMIFFIFKQLVLLCGPIYGLIGIFYQLIFIKQKIKSKYFVIKIKAGRFFWIIIVIILFRYSGKPVTIYYNLKLNQEYKISY